MSELMTENDLINWINNILDIGIASFDDLKDGEIYCHLYCFAHPNTIDLTRLGITGMLNWHILHKEIKNKKTFPPFSPTLIMHGDKQNNVAFCRIMHEYVNDLEKKRQNEDVPAIMFNDTSPQENGKFSNSKLLNLETDENIIDLNNNNNNINLDNENKKNKNKINKKFCIEKKQSDGNINDSYDNNSVMSSFCRRKEGLLARKSCGDDESKSEESYNDDNECIDELKNIELTLLKSSYENKTRKSCYENEIEYNSNNSDDKLIVPNEIAKLNENKINLNNINYKDTFCIGGEEVNSDDSFKNIDIEYNDSDINDKNTTNEGGEEGILLEYDDCEDNDDDINDSSYDNISIE